jgi:hypothetical protein
MKTSLFVIAAAIVIILAAGNAAHATREHCTEHQIYDHDKHQCIEKVQEEQGPEPTPEPVPEPAPVAAPVVEPVLVPSPSGANWGK